jgi:hypothetical protein
MFSFRFSALITILGVVGCAPQGLHVIPEHSPYAGKKVLIYTSSSSKSEEHVNLVPILASKIPYPVVDFDSLGNQIDLFSCVGNGDERLYDLLSTLDVGIVISIGPVSYRRQFIRDVPIVQFTMKGQPPQWEWIFLSLAEADFKVYDIVTRKVLLQDRFPPNNGQEPGFRVVLAPGPLHNVNTVFTGEDSDIAATKPGDWHYQVADRKAIEKLVDYIVSNTKPSGTGLQIPGSVAGSSDITCARTLIDDDIRNLAQTIAEQMNAHGKQVLAIGYIGSDANTSSQAAKVDKILDKELHQMKGIIIVPRDLSNRIRNSLGLNSRTMDSHPEITVQFGNLSNADVILYGEVQETGSGMKIVINLYNTDDGRLLGQHQVEIDKDRILQEAVRGLVP